MGKCHRRRSLEAFRALSLLGLKRRSNEQARQDYMNEVGPILIQMGLKIPDPNKGRHYM